MATCRLHYFKPVLGDWKSAYRENRKQEKMLSRLRTGTCKFHVKIHFPENNDPEMCRNCNILMTLQHLLVDYPALQQKLTPIISFTNILIVN